MMDLKKTFHEIEYEAWSKRAGEYDALFAPVSTQAINAILNSLGNNEGIRHLDVACGTGHLVAAAAKRGASSEGIDFAETMVEAARSNYPGEHFEVADAARLPYSGGTFHGVTCAFGLLHMEYPAAAIREAFRVLKPGGRFAFSLWHSAKDGNEALAIIQEALDACVCTPFALPEAWTLLRYADETACHALTAQAGFEPPVFQRLPIALRVKSTQEVAAIVDKLSIRTKMVVDHQPPEIQQRIIETIRLKAENYRANGIIELAWPALLTVVQKPGWEEIA